MRFLIKTLCIYQQGEGLAVNERYICGDIVRSL